VIAAADLIGLTNLTPVDGGGGAAPPQPAEAERAAPLSAPPIPRRTSV
jgi:hypothetical protein